MNLILDIGNTLAKVAAVKDDETVFSKSYEDLSLTALTELIAEYSPDKSIVSCVGRLNPKILDYLQNQTKAIVLNQHTRLPIGSYYQTPETLGYDRIAVAVGANYLYPNRNLLIIDAGTAITYDIVTSENNYIGGAISPGVSLRFKSLNLFTEKLPLLQKTENFPLVGQDTSSCIHSGVLNGIIAEIDGYTHNVTTIYGDIIAVLTGGDSNFFANKLKNSIFVNQNLMVTGLNRILEFNV